MFVYVGGWIDCCVGSVQLFSYMCGFVCVVQVSGVVVYGLICVVGLMCVDGCWQVVMFGGVMLLVVCVVIVINGYMDGLWFGLCQLVIVVNSFIVVM